MGLKNYVLWRSHADIYSRAGLDNSKVWESLFEHHFGNIKITVCIYVRVCVNITLTNLNYANNVKQCAFSLKKKKSLHAEFENFDKKP